MRRTELRGKSTRQTRRRRRPRGGLSRSVLTRLPSTTTRPPSLACGQWRGTSLSTSKASLRRSVGLPMLLLAAVARTLASDSLLSARYCHCCRRQPPTSAWRRAASPWRPPSPQARRCAGSARATDVVVSCVVNVNCGFTRLWAQSHIWLSYATPALRLEVRRTAAGRSRVASCVRQRCGTDSTRLR